MFFLKTVVFCLFSLSTVKTQWILSWSDDFEGDAGSPPDSTKWRHEIGGIAWSLQQLQYYTTSTNNAALDGNGNLLITARNDDASQHQCWYGTCQYTSASINTFGVLNQTYGRYEARLQFPQGKGLWPAFWMMGTDVVPDLWPACGEIDIAQIRGSDPTTVIAVMFGPGYEDGVGTSTTYRNPNGDSFSDEFHVFAVEWFPDSVTWFVDDASILVLTPANLNGNPWVFDHPFYVILDHAVGGLLDGDPDDSVVFPQSLIVDYVRVYS